MTHQNISERVFNTIKERGITPKPKWQFLLKNSLLWVVAIGTIFLGAISFAILVFLFQNNDWDFYQYIHQHLISFLVFSLPFLWMGLFLMFIFLAQYQMKRTKHGYRYSLKYLFGIVLFFTMFLGIIFYQIGFGQAIDEKLASSFTLYKEILSNREMRWSQPLEGLLSGTVLSVQTNRFELKDFQGKTWTITITPQTHIFPFFHIETTDRLRLIGKQINVNTFEAQRIGPWILRKPQLFKKFLFEKKSE